MQPPAATATLALHLEAVAAPTPGNVDRSRDHPELRLEQFLAGAVGARDGLALAAEGAPLGEAFETAVEGMARRAGSNTQFGALLLLVPLVRAAAFDDLDPAGLDRITADTTVEDAAGFYRSFDHVDVRVEDPPEGMDALDVRRGSDAIPELEARGLTLRDVLAESAERDGVAREWTSGFDRTFETAARLVGDGDTTGSPAPVDQWITDADRLVDRAARTHLVLLADDLDSLVVTAHGEAAATDVRNRARDLLSGLPESPPKAAAIEAFAAELIEEGINPGMTADHLAAGLFVALQQEAVEL